MVDLKTPVPPLYTQSKDEAENLGAMREPAVTPEDLEGCEAFVEDLRKEFQ